jgi:hypothetical protein
MRPRLDLPVTLLVRTPIQVKGNDPSPLSFSHLALRPLRLPLLLVFAGGLIPYRGAQCQAPSNHTIISYRGVYGTQDLVPIVAYGSCTQGLSQSRAPAAIKLEDSRHLARGEQGTTAIHGNESHGKDT